MSLFWLKAVIKAVNLEERTVEGFASTMQPDMIRDVILARAWRKSLARWKKRGSIPKFIGYHQHRLLTGHSPVLGPMQKLNVVPDGLMLKGEFAETELGEEHLHLYSIGAMDYFSVGFNIMPDGSTMDPAQVQRLLVANKITALVPQEVDRVITEAELFEVSCVVLGANLGALVTASADPGQCCGLCDGKDKRHCNGKEERSLKVRYAKRMLERLEACAKLIPDGTGAAVYEDPEKYFIDDTSEEKSKRKPKEKVILSAKALEEACAKPSVEDGIDELVHPKFLPLPELPEDGTVTEKELAAAEERLASATQAEGTKVDPLLEIKRVIPFKDYGHVENEGAAWRAAAEVRAASVEDLLKMCTWYDADHVGAKSSYKLPHHRQSDFKAIWRGVAAAMGALLGSRGGVDIPSGEKRGSYNHIKKHYKDWDKEAPEFREYNSDELKALEEKGLLLTPETVDAETRALDSEQLSAIFENVKSLEARTAKLESGVAAVQNGLDLLRTASAKSGEPGGAEPQTEPAAEEAKDADEEVDGVPVLKEILTTLEEAAGK